METQFRCGSKRFKRAEHVLPRSPSAQTRPRSRELQRVAGPRTGRTRNRIALPCPTAESRVDFGSEGLEWWAFLSPLACLRARIEVEPGNHADGLGWHPSAARSSCGIRQPSLSAPQHHAVAGTEGCGVERSLLNSLRNSPVMLSGRPENTDQDSRKTCPDLEIVRRPGTRRTDRVTGGDG
jgi:hypothetical protein